VSLQFYKACIVSMTSHGLALAVVLYYMLQGHLLNNVLGWDEVKVEVPGWVFFGFLLAMLIVEITLTVRAVCRIALCTRIRSLLCPPGVYDRSLL
jgi:hypothetical protein